MRTSRLTCGNKSSSMTRSRSTLSAEAVPPKPGPHAAGSVARSTAVTSGTTAAPPPPPPLCAPFPPPGAGAPAAVVTDPAAATASWGCWASAWSANLATRLARSLTRTAASAWSLFAPVASPRCCRMTGDEPPKSTSHAADIRAASSIRVAFAKKMSPGKKKFSTAPTSTFFFMPTSSSSPLRSPPPVAHAVGSRP